MLDQANAKRSVDRLAGKWKTYELTWKLGAYLLSFCKATGAVFGKEPNFESPCEEKEDLSSMAR